MKICPRGGIHILDSLLSSLTNCYGYQYPRSHDMMAQSPLQHSSELLSFDDDTPVSTTIHSFLTLYQSIMSTTSSIVIVQPGEPVIYCVVATSMEDIKEAIAPELSSPITSYDSEGATLQHHRSYPVRLKVCITV